VTNVAGQNEFVDVDMNKGDDEFAMDVGFVSNIVATSVGIDVEFDAVDNKGNEDDEVNVIKFVLFDGAFSFCKRRNTINCSLPRFSIKNLD
jgi:hypothetical protein